jgi:hypothetical protein
MVSVPAARSLASSGDSARKKGRHRALLPPRLRGLSVVRRGGHRFPQPRGTASLSPRADVTGRRMGAGVFALLRLRRLAGVFRGLDEEKRAQNAVEKALRALQPLFPFLRRCARRIERSNSAARPGGAFRPALAPRITPRFAPRLDSEVPLASEALCRPAWMVVRAGATNRGRPPLVASRHRGLGTEWPGTHRLAPESSP